MNFDGLKKSIGNNPHPALSNLKGNFGEVKKEEKEEKIKNPKELEDDIASLKKEGYSLDDILEAIEEMEGVDKDEAKKTAKDKFGDKPAEIIIIRHGSTKLNSEDKIRGWRNVPLDEHGKKEAKEMGIKLRGQNIDGMVVSDLGRTQETAEIIADETGIPILEITRDFRPWNVGIHTGESGEKVFPILKEFSKEKPDEKIPEGESFNTFKNRFLNGIKRIKEEYKNKRIGVVTHHRGDRIMAAWENAGTPDNNDIDEDTFIEKGIEPGDFRNEGEKLNYPKGA